ncbi:MAG: hypothetical protein FD138_1193 [Planctomycetota bacterium]|nr:MAG: hypothetical protein FD138_1193 [Planctomycetota bacterium]
MPHYPKPFFREARGLWYVQVDGKQINLGVDREAAFCQYHQLMQQPQNATSTASVSVASIVDAFLDWSQKHRAFRTYRRYLEYCQSFVEMFPDLLVAELKPFHVQEWVDSHAGWGNTTKRSAVTAMKRAFNWAEKQGRVAATPIRHAEMPPPDKREEFITKEEHERVLSLVKDQHFRDLLVLAWETGARPQELFRLESRHVDLENARWVFPKSESKGKRQSRTIYLSDAALEVTRRLAKKRKVGAMLRNAHGAPWTAMAVNCRFHRLKEPLGKKVCLYLWRHGFAHRMLSQQVDSLVVATLMGHVDTTMLSTVYGHLMKNQKLLRETVQKSVS